MRKKETKGQPVFGNFLKNKVQISHLGKEVKDRKLFRVRKCVLA